MNWRELNHNLKQLGEHEVKALLDAELEGRQRVTYLHRIHQRYCALRAVRERTEMMASRRSATQVS